MLPKIAVLIPDRGDRPEFTDHCLWMMNRQSLKPVEIIHVAYPPDSNLGDITQRYRIGYESVTDPSIDFIAFIENDDYYHQDYLRFMSLEFEAAGRPDLMGTQHSTYYHIGLLRYAQLTHYTRSTAMNTIIRPGLKINWPADHEPYTDMHLWMNVPGIKKHLFTTPTYLSMGIKHGTGLCGGGSHVDRFHKYKHDDSGMDFLRGIVDPESLEFYQKIHQRIKPSFQGMDFNGL